MSHTPPSFGTRGGLILNIAVDPYSIYQFQFFPLVYSTGEPVTGSKPGGVSTTFNGLQHQNRHFALGLYHCSIRGLLQKISAVDFTVASNGIFPMFPSFFCLHKDSNHVLLAYLPGRWLSTHRAAVKTPPDPTPTRDLHRDTQHLGW